MLLIIQAVLVCAIISFIVTKIYVERAINYSRASSLIIAKEKLKLAEEKIIFIEEKRAKNPSLLKPIHDESGRLVSYAEYEALKKEFPNPNYDIEESKNLRDEYFLLSQERHILSQEIKYLSQPYKVRLFEV
jgi:hypothetical protein